LKALVFPPASSGDKSEGFVDFEVFKSVFFPPFAISHIEISQKVIQAKSSKDDNDVLSGENSRPAARNARTSL
jgi:hypothetical protein